MRAEGFSLLEVLVAMAIVGLGLASLAQLFVLSADASRQAQASSTALLLAQEKIEALQADVGLVGASPPGTLDADTPGHVDYVDSGAFYVRRWSVVPLPGSPRDSVVLQVVVVPWRTLPGGVRGAVHLVSIKARKAG